MSKFSRQGFPDHTRLRFVSAKDPMDIQLFLRKIQRRIEIKGNPTFVEGRWYVWFVPGDQESDIKTIEL